MKAVVKNPDRKVSTSKRIDKKKTHIPILATDNARYKIIIFSMPRTDMTPFPARERKCLFFNLSSS